MSGFLDSDSSGATNRRILKLVDLPLVGEAIGKRYRCWECYKFWNNLYAGFAEPYRDLFAEDVTPIAAQRIRKAFENIGTEQRNQILIKITGWPRMGFLQAIWPDARFIHILRDGRAVANSNLEVDFWDGWLGPDNWRFGPLTSEQRELWEKSGQSFVALAGIEWNHLMDAVEHARTLIPSDQFLEIKYEDFCEDPVRETRKMTDFGGLEWTPGFEQTIRQGEFKNQNAKWRKELSSEQQALLETVMAEHIKRYGYEGRDYSNLEIKRYTR